MYPASRLHDQPVFTVPLVKPVVAFKCIILLDADVSCQMIVPMVTASSAACSSCVALAFFEGERQ